MYEEQNYNFCNINLDFLDSSPPLQPTQEAPQLNKCTDSFSAVEFPLGNQSSSQRSDKVRQLAQRIASTDTLVQRVKQLEREQEQLHQQLKNFQQSAKEIQQLYETEKQQHNNLQTKTIELQNKYDKLDAEIANNTLQRDQLQAQLEHYKGPVDFSELAAKYLYLAQKVSDEQPLHWHQQSLVEELNNYCLQKNIRIPTAKSPKKRRTRTTKHEKGIQCDLLPLNSPAPIVSNEKKELRCQGIQCDNVIQTQSQGTQHISTTTTRSTSTSCFIKQHHVGTCFPEPAPLPSFDDILHELVNWDNKSRITPIEDNLPILSATTATTASQVESQIIEFKTIGTCTSLCNIRKHIDFIPQFHTIKRSNSRPPSRAMYDGIKHEASTPPPTTASKPTNTSSIRASSFLQFSSLNNLQPSAFEELWQVFGHMLLGLLQNHNGNLSSISDNSSSDAVSQHEFHDWMRSLYESMQQQQQLNQSDPLLCSSTMDILSNTNILRPLAHRDCCNQERPHSPESQEDRLSTVEQQRMDASPRLFNPAIYDENVLNDKICEAHNASMEQIIYSRLPSSQQINAEETVIMAAQKSENDVVKIVTSASKENSKESRCAIKKLKKKRNKHRKLRRSTGSALESCESAVDFIATLSSFEDYSTIETAIENNNSESENICNAITNTEVEFKKPLKRSKDVRSAEYSLFGSVSDIECDNEEEAENGKEPTLIIAKHGDGLPLAAEQNKNSDIFKCPITVSNNTNYSYIDTTGKNLSEQPQLERNKSLGNRAKSVPNEKVNVTVKNVEDLNETLAAFGTYKSSERQVDEQVIEHNNIAANLIDSDETDNIYETDLIIDEQCSEEDESLHYHIGNNNSSNSIEKELYNLEDISKSPAQHNSLLFRDRTNFKNILSESSNGIIADICSNGETHKDDSDNTDAIPNIPTTFTSVSISNEPGKRQSEAYPVHSIWKRSDSLHPKNTCHKNDDSITVLGKPRVAIKRKLTEISSKLPSKIKFDDLKVSDNAVRKECYPNPSIFNSLTSGHLDDNFKNFTQQHRINQSNKLIKLNITAISESDINSPIDFAQPCIENENALEANTNEMQISAIEYNASLNTFSQNTCSSPTSPSSVVSSSTKIACTTKNDTMPSIIQIEYDTFASPASPVSSTTEHSPTTSPKEIPLELNARNYPHKHSSFLQRIIACYSSEQFKIINSKYSTKEISERRGLEMQINAQIQKYLQISAENPDVEAATLVRNLQAITQNDVLIAKSIVEHMMDVPRPEIELACAIDDVPSNYLGALHRSISYAMRHLHYIRPEFSNVLLSQIEGTLFNYQNVEKLSLCAAVSLTKLYMLATSNQLTNMQANPARIFIAKCLYYHQLKAISMIYEVLCCFPTTLPHREDRTYDRSDALITVIQHQLMCTKYDMENRELPTKELLSKLRFVYHFEPFKPTADEVLANLVEKLKAGKLSNIKYAFAIFCKRLHPTKVTAEVLQAQLIPLANEYHRLVLESSAYDERVTALLDCISAVIKPFPVSTNISVYLSIFSHFLNAVERSVVQEAAVQAILRLQRFGLVNCFNALLLFKPTYNLHPNTKAMLKTFIHRKPLSFWRTLIAQTALVPN